MSGRLAACLMFAFSVLLAVPAAAEKKPSAIIGQAIDGFIRPGYRDFHRATTDLTTTTQALCTAPSQEALDSARKAFGDAVDAWSTIEIIRFGPVTEQNRLERVLFWPDRKGTGLKQVQAALAAKDPSATDAAQLAGKSVAMQGLGALEFVLFGAGADALSGEGDAYRCAYGSAIAANLDGIITTDRARRRLRGVSRPNRIAHRGNAGSRTTHAPRDGARRSAGDDIGRRDHDGEPSRGADVSSNTDRAHRLGDLDAVQRVRSSRKFGESDVARPATGCDVSGGGRMDTTESTGQ